MPLCDSRHPGLTEPWPVGRRNYLCITYVLFWPHKDMECLHGWGISSMRGYLRDYTNMKDDIDTIHAPIHFNKANMKGWLWRPNDIRGPYGPKVSWHLDDKFQKKIVPWPGFEPRSPVFRTGGLTNSPTETRIPTKEQTSLSFKFSIQDFSWMHHVTIR